MDNNFDLLYSLITQKDYHHSLQLLKNIFQTLLDSNESSVLTERFTSCFKSLLQDITSLPLTEGNSDLVSCVTACFRICRNSCANCAENQRFLGQHKLISLTNGVLEKLGSCDRVNDELLVLARCGVQFIGNFASGNSENQTIVIEVFIQTFKLLLQIQDEKLQQYVCMVVHTCLSSPEAHQRVQEDVQCWSLLMAVIKLCVEKEAPWGLYVIEDALVFPRFCDNILQFVNAQERSVLTERFTSCFKSLLQDITSLPLTEGNSDLVSCVTACFRICRNSCANCAENQRFLGQHKLISLTNGVLEKLGSCDRVNDELLVLARCGVQFIGNFASGNSENQTIVIEVFIQTFKLLLQIQDEKLQQYVCMVVHTCLSSPEAHQRVQEDVQCWSLLMAVIKLCVEKEAPWGLYVIEDALVFPRFCDNILQFVNAQERLIVLEVLVNHLKSLNGEEEEANTTTTKLPALSNLQHIAEHYKHSTEHVLTMQDTGSSEDLEHMVTVKELETLSLATALHKSYGSLLDDTDLLRSCIGLLYKIDQIGRQGNNVFSNIAKISKEGEIDPHHPVFGLKRDLIRLIGNMGYRHKSNQDLVRELQGLPLILDQTNIDGKNPFITQWSVFAVHNLTEVNDENKKFIAQFNMQGEADKQPALEELGIQVQTDGDKIGISKLKK